MRGCLIVGLAAALGATVATAQEERRELGAHEHGHAALNIAVEGKRVAMEFRAPGMDVVGFEHEAATDADKAAVRRAEAALKDPLALFVLPSAAGCKVVTAKVGLEAEEEHEAGHVEGERHVRGEAAVEEGEHTEFHAEYALDCADPGRIDAITFAFFEMFPGAEEIEVTLLTERGQTSYEVERDRPRLAIGGSS